MHRNVKLIHEFYNAFARLDYRAMQEAYADEAIFYDPVFQNLDAAQARSMWQMLCTNAKNFSLRHSEVIADEDYGSCNWTANYTFSATRRLVHNKIHAHFRFKEGKIIEHQDNFNFYTWSRQALGLRGTLLGWSNVLREKVRKQAMQNLHNFIVVNERLTP